MRGGGDRNQLLPGIAALRPFGPRPGDRRGGGGSGGGRRCVRERVSGDDRVPVRNARDPPGSASWGRTCRGRLPHPALADEGGPCGSRPGSSGTALVSVRGVPVRRRREWRIRRDGAGTGMAGTCGPVPGNCGRSGRRGRAEAVASCGRSHSIERGTRHPRGAPVRGRRRLGGGIVPGAEGPGKGKIVHRTRESGVPNCRGVGESGRRIRRATSAPSGEDMSPRR